FEELKAIQGLHGYLPAEQLELLSKKIDVPLYRLHGVASFYPHFHLTPPARAEIRICSDMSCHLRGAGELKACLERQFVGTNPKEVTIREISCLGQCDGAPAISINDQIYRNVSGFQAEEMVRSLLTGHALPEPMVEHTRFTLASDPYRDGEKYGVVHQLVRSRDWDAVMATLKASGLRGLGGAGASAEMKWSAARRTSGPEKYVICNADESEPGTIKDRFIMTHLPHLVMEGMILAGLTVGAQKGILYIRHEYPQLESILQEEVLHCRREGLLGKSVLGTELSFDIEIFVSPGGYVCGEETALLEAIEGKRAEPRNKPPFPAEIGLWGKPTVLNNVETFINVPQILARGLDWYRAQGQGGAAGLKFIGVSGDVVQPGVFEVAMGTPASDLIFKRAGGLQPGKKLKAFAPSGPSSGYLPASMADVRLDFDSLKAVGSMLGSGALVVCADDTCMLDMALNAVRFFRNESCGKCVPCRVGSQKLVDILTGWTQGRGTLDDFALVDELSDALRMTSICGLGQVVPAPIASVLKHFREEVEAHFLRRKCATGVCSVAGGKQR
ncbi:MAG: NAD(P)H-dependent oxidoreductase subunit E, partial [Verrucomicrobiales bacterium]|nr:NAD(P)H-dependent oxidoreductase subunit E [Verrucomicrobiales bacterium]